MDNLFDDWTQHLVLAHSENTNKTTETCLQLWKDLLRFICYLEEQYLCVCYLDWGKLLGVASADISEVKCWEELFPQSVMLLNHLQKVQ